MTEWYRNLSLRERRFVSLGILFVVLLMTYAFIYLPLEDALEANKTNLEKKQSEWTQLVRIASEYKKLGAATDIPVSNDNQSLLALIDQSGSVVGIKSSIKTLTPEGEHKVRVRVEDVPFDKLVEWLVVNSAKHLIHAELLIARRTEKSGMVDATLLFVRD